MLKAAAIPERLFRSGTGATSFPAPTLEAGPCAGSCEARLRGRPRLSRNSSLFQYPESVVHDSDMLRSGRIQDFPK